MEEARDYDQNRLALVFLYVFPHPSSSFSHSLLYRIAFTRCWSTEVCNCDSGIDLVCALYFIRRIKAPYHFRRMVNRSVLSSHSSTAASSAHP